MAAPTAGKALCGSGPSIRGFPRDIEAALEEIAPAGKLKVAERPTSSIALHSLRESSFRLADDAGKALCVVQLALAAPAPSSRLVDNLNASVHLRNLLTDMSVLDETLRLCARQ